MPTSTEDIIKSKLAAMGIYLEKLLPLVDRYKRGEISLNSDEVHVMERMFQLAVDAAIDINTHIIVQKGLESPDTYEGTFSILGRNNIIPISLGDKISGSVALRNRMVHGYEKVQVKKMLNDIAGGIGQYIEYMKHISDFVEKFIAVN